MRRRWVLTGWIYLSHRERHENGGRYIEPGHPEALPEIRDEGRKNRAIRYTVAPFIKTNFRDAERHLHYRMRVSQTYGVPMVVKFTDVQLNIDLSFLGDRRFEFQGNRWDANAEVVNTAYGYSVKDAPTQVAANAATWYETAVYVL